MTDNKMTAEDLAEYLMDWSVVKDNPFSQVVGGKAAQMLRRQHEAIKQLREALGNYIESDQTACDYGVGVGGDAMFEAKQALKDTEGL